MYSDKVTRSMEVLLTLRKGKYLRLVTVTRKPVWVGGGGGSKKAKAAKSTQTDLADTLCVLEAMTD